MPKHYLFLLTLLKNPHNIIDRDINVISSTHFNCLIAGNTEVFTLCT